MARKIVSCPQCGYAKEIDEDSLPPLGTRGTCPRCKGVFSLSDELLSSPPEQGRLFAQSPSDAADPSAAPAAPQLRTLTFTFTGSGKEYFGIWIVNTLLRIVTLGIYSPWAKVRKRRYFYGNTLLNDAPFDYLADPLAILKGWIVAACFIGLYSFATKVSPVVASIMMLAFFGIFPWVVVRSRIFNLRNSTHRNIRFNFTEDYREAYRVFLWWQLLVPFTLGLLAPYVIYRQKWFLVENSSFGTTRFRFHGTARDFYRIFVPVMVGAVLCIGLFVGIVLLSKQGMANPALSLVPSFLLMIIYLFAAVYIPTVMTNLTWSSTSLGSHRFTSTLRVRDLLWIHFSNIIAVIFSIGLLAPWATVRLVRYRLGRLTLSGAGDLEASASGDQEAVKATAEEFSDMMGFDLGL